MTIDIFSSFIRENYEIYQWRHACAILHKDFPGEFADLSDLLERFRLKKSWIVVGGGRKSKVADWIDTELALRGWQAKNFDTRIVVNDQTTEFPTLRGRLLQESHCLGDRVEQQGPFL